MSKTDENIKNILQEKFASHESAVNPEIWNSISTGLSSASTSTAASYSIGKIIGIAAAIVVATVTTVLVLNSSNKEGKIATNTSVESAKSTESSTNNSVSESSAKQDKSIPTLQATSSNSSIPSLEFPIDSETNEDLKDGKWQDVDDSVLGIKDGIESNQIPSDHRNDTQTVYNDTEEPISASFHTKVVDASAMRYFFFPKTSANATFKWSSSDGYSSNDITFSHQFSEEGNYTIELTATDKSGNIATESSTVQVVKPIAFKIPNAFSPGINGRNDIINFEESTQNEASIVSIAVFDRNGTVVYESNNDFIWNGTNKTGELAPVGVYTFIITAIDKLGKSQMNKGTIQLFRE